MSEQVDRVFSHPVPEYEDYQTKTDLILPFRGVWYVGNGGRDVDSNSHLLAPPERLNDQRYAIDFIGVAENGLPYSNTGWELTDYVAFGQEVVAPGDGVISQVVNGSFDMPIGEEDHNVITGNMVVINHNNGEWSVLCHFQHESIKVKAGDEVKQGDVLGQCGNSGQSTQPHIHYQLQDGPRLHTANGLPVQFSRIKVGEEIREKVELEKGQKVENV